MKWIFLFLMLSEFSAEVWVGMEALDRCWGRSHRRGLPWAGGCDPLQLLWCGFWGEGRGSDRSADYREDHDTGCCCGRWLGCYCEGCWRVWVDWGVISNWDFVVGEGNLASGTCFESSQWLASSWVFPVDAVCTLHGVLRLVSTIEYCCLHLFAKFLCFCTILFL